MEDVASSERMVVLGLPQRSAEMITLADYRNLLTFRNGQKNEKQESVLDQVLSSDTPESRHLDA